MQYIGFNRWVDLVLESIWPINPYGWPLSTALFNMHIVRIDMNGKCKWIWEGRKNANSSAHTHTFIANSDWIRTEQVFCPHWLCGVPFLSQRKQKFVWPLFFSIDFFHSFHFHLYFRHFSTFICIFGLFLLNHFLCDFDLHPPFTFHFVWFQYKCENDLLLVRFKLSKMCSTPPHTAHFSIWLGRSLRTGIKSEDKKKPAFPFDCVCMDFVGVSIWSVCWLNFDFLLRPCALLIYLHVMCILERKKKVQHKLESGTRWCLCFRVRYFSRPICLHIV